MAGLLAASPRPPAAFRPATPGASPPRQICRCQRDGPAAQAPTSRAQASRQEQQLLATEPRDGGVTRREGTLLAVLAGTMLLSGTPAKAFLGFGEPSADEVYARDTGNIIKSVLGTLSISKDDPKKEDAVKEVRLQTNAWVARYRRSGFGGRPSYGNTYSALNALAGHYNSFGLTTPLPKKRLDRITKELNDAEKLLGRGR